MQDDRPYPQRITRGRRYARPFRAEQTLPVLSDDPPAGRREGRRIAAPVGLIVSISASEYAALEMWVVPAHGAEPVPCFLYDVDVGGIGIACGEVLQAGDEVRVLCALADNDRWFLEDHARVTHGRPFPAGRACAEGFTGRSLTVYGLALPRESAAVLNDATLACRQVYLEAIRAGVLEAEPPPSSLRKPVTVSEIHNPVAFNAIPLATVEYTEEEIRRRAVRIEIASPLQIHDASAAIAPVRLYLRDPRRAAGSRFPAALLNYSPCGAGLLSTGRFNLGNVVQVIGMVGHGDEPCFENTFRVRSLRTPDRLRRSTAGKGSALGEEVFFYGLELLPEQENRLYKAVLESIYLEHLESCVDPG